MVEGGPGFPFVFHALWLLPLFVLFVVGAVALIVWAVRASGRPAYPMGPSSPMPLGAPPAARETPLDILARRFASGEITAEEYQRARDLLGGGGKT